jgi:hypothetical protein
MTTELEREHLGLKAAANALNQKANLLLVAVEVIMEHRQLNNRLLEHADKLRAKLNEATESTGGAVPGQAQPNAQPDNRGPSGAGVAGPAA